MASSDSHLLPYGDGASKLFGMENFGNTCYCNSILQCLFYTHKFRQRVLLHEYEPHLRRADMPGAYPHPYTVKYEQLLAKKIKEKTRPTVSAGSDISSSSPSLAGTCTSSSRPSMRNSFFGKFSSQVTPVVSVEDALVGSCCSQTKDFIHEAGNCEYLSVEQRLIVRKNPDLHHLPLFVTRPGSAGKPDIKTDSSGTSSTLVELEHHDGSENLLPSQPPVSSSSSYVVVGIPTPEQGISPPINPFSANPSSDHKKRSALINGPIVNVDQPLSEHSECIEKCLLYALKDIFEAMTENSSQIGVVSPSYFIKRLKEKNFLFRQANMHHDAHEFCNYLINEIIETITMESKSETNWCNDLFQGTITNETKCLSCETVTSRDESFLDLSVDIPPGDGACSLTFSLNNFSKSEMLNHQNKFYCNACSSLQEAIKTIKIKKTPKVLVINLKRFKYDDKLDCMVKLFDSISYPLNLRLFNATSKSYVTSSGPTNEFSLYGLYALVVHIGGGPMHGHYVALCKCKAGLWFLFDDETVELVDDSYVLQFFGDGPGLASAYILFYEVLDTKVLEDGIDFGIDMAKVYNGTDYDTAMLKNEVKETQIDQVIPEVDVVEAYLPFEQKPAEFCEEKGVGRTTSLLKKTFMLDSKDDKSKDSGSTFLAGKLGKSTDNILERPVIKSEKKSWVGSLKRRESKSDVITKERIPSTSSANSTTTGAGSGIGSGTGTGTATTTTTTTTAATATATADTSISEEICTEKAKRKGSIFSFKRKTKS